jgi:tetratricopeptide (TPR) repeat protein
MGIFSTFLVGNYHPLTVLSLALDYWVFGLNPSGFHLTNIIIHTCNTALAYAVVRLLCGNHQIAIVTALLFGIHPMHVESVTWISERKDVLYSFFYLSALSVYLVSVRQDRNRRQHSAFRMETRSDLHRRNDRAIQKLPENGEFCPVSPITPVQIQHRTGAKSVLLSLVSVLADRNYLLSTKAAIVSRKDYLVTILLFLCALLSKGQAVTLPVVLLLVDYVKGRRWSRPLLLEKIPFFALSLLFGVVAIVAQKDTGAIPDMPTFSLAERVPFAFYNILLYVVKLVAPLKLSAFYPYPEALRWSVYIALGAAVLVVSALVWLAARFANRFLIFGAGFFIVNMALLLQVLPVGASMIAERYTYLGSLGLFFLAAYGSVQVLNRKGVQEGALGMALIFVFALYCSWLGYTTIQRNRVWHSSESLWSDVLRQFPRVPVAYLNRGSYYQLEGQIEKALADFNSGLALNPDHYDILTNRCDVFRLLGEYDRSIDDCSRVIEKMKNHAVAYTNRGITYSMIGRIDEAMADFERAIALEPKNPKLYSNRGNLHDMSGMFDAAIEDYSYAISLRPDYSTAYFNRAKTKIRKGDLAGAILDFDVSTKSLELAADSYFYRSQAHKLTGNYSQALHDAQSAQRLGRRVDAQYLTELAAQQLPAY